VNAERLEHDATATTARDDGDQVERDLQFTPKSGREVSTVDDRAALWRLPYSTNQK
jgi:hypothetical protein